MGRIPRRRLGDGVFHVINRAIDGRFIFDEACGRKLYWFSGNWTNWVGLLVGSFGWPFGLLWCIIPASCTQVRIGINRFGHFVPFAIYTILPWAPPLEWCGMRLNDQKGNSLLTVILRTSTRTFLSCGCQLLISLSIWINDARPASMSVGVTYPIALCSRFVL